MLFQVAIALLFICKHVLLNGEKPPDISNTLALLKVAHFVGSSHLTPSDKHRISRNIAMTASFSFGYAITLLVPFFFLSALITERFSS